MIAKIQVVLPVSRHRLVSAENEQQQHDQAIQEILALSGTISCRTGSSCSQTVLPIKIAINPCLEQQVSALWQPHPMRIFTFLELDVDLEIEPSKWKPSIERVAADSMSTQPLSDTMLIHSVSGQLQEIAHQVVFAANIGLPGSIEVENCFTFAEGQLVCSSQRILSDILGFHAQLARERAWPPVTSIPVAHVWRWLQDIDGFAEALPRGPAGRAIAALSNLMRAMHIEDSVALMWALVGLEALYTAGRGGYGSQLLEKSELVLGTWPTRKRLRRDLYKLRSEFIHGDIDLALSYGQRDDWDNPGTFDERASQVVPIAISMLLSSIQKLILMDLQEFEFKYSLAEMSANRTIK